MAIKAARNRYSGALRLIGRRNTGIEAPVLAIRLRIIKAAAMGKAEVLGEAAAVCVHRVAIHSLGHGAGCLAHLCCMNIHGCQCGKRSKLLEHGTHVNCSPKRAWLPRRNGVVMTSRWKPPVVLLISLRCVVGLLMPTKTMHVPANSKIICSGTGSCRAALSIISCLPPATPHRPPVPSASSPTPGTPPPPSSSASCPPRHSPSCPPRSPARPSTTAATRRPAALPRLPTRRERPPTTCPTSWTCGAGHRARP